MKTSTIHLLFANLKPSSKRTLQVFALLAISALLCKCKKDVVAPSNTITPDATMNATTDTTAHLFSASNRLSTIVSYNIASSLPSGYVKTGTKDYTSYVQDALNSHTNVTFPAFPIMVSDVGLIVKSNANITFLSGAKLILKPSSNTNYTILRVLNASNVTITNPVIVGDRYNHLGTTGEWGQGLGIYASSNVTITNANVTNCWGDGIYLAATNGVGNKNITITNAYCKSNRRNGISVTNVVGLLLNSPYAGYCDGTGPFTGIDFEVASYTDNLQNIIINNPLTEHNKANGISIGLRRLFGGPNKTVSFTINNPVDKSSAVGLKTTITLARRVGSETVTGPITVVAPSWRQNPIAPMVVNLFVKTIKLSISKPAVMNLNGLWLSESQVLSLLNSEMGIANYSITF